ncbi:MAG: hypothetical protein N2645_22225 [Clostridia bacterium]|nr:hypothetical protein [Clostridia bacterium]
MGHVEDVHSYPDPSCPSSQTKARVCGEYGGISYKIDEHVWGTGNYAYCEVNNADDFASLYDRFADEITLYKTNKGLSAILWLIHLGHRVSHTNPGIL